MPQDTTEPTWAADTNFASGPHSGLPTKTASGDPDQGFVGPTLAKNELNEILHKLAVWLNDAGRGFYGDGSDGDATITGGTTTLTRDMYYDNLTITGTGVLRPAGYRVFVRGLLTIQTGGVIERNGNAGGTPANAITGGTAGAALAAGSLGGSGAGGAGGNASTAGTGGSNANDGAGGAGGAGGGSHDTGDDAAEAGGAGGSVAWPQAVSTSGLRHLAHALGIYHAVTTGAATIVAGGAGGGGGAGGDSGTGGGGGSGGGAMVVAAYRLANAGTIRANGGAGGAAYTGPDAAGNGGGGGGGGGVIWLITRASTGAGTVEALGGAGGAGHLAGDDGEDGDDGAVVLLSA